jgi:hypothetical protein
MTVLDEPTTTHGEVFTRRWVVEVLLDLTGYTADRDLGVLTLCEPSVGAGAFLVPIVERLIASAHRHGRRLEHLHGALRSFDLQGHNVEFCRSLIVPLLVNGGCGEAEALDLAESWVTEADFLLDDTAIEADVVVGNPPYIRLEDLDPAVSDEYRRRWPTMAGRADIYVGFYERCLSILTPGGRLGFICADRWMRNQYGARLRQLVAGQYAVDAVWVMHDVDAFEEQVSAYPAITVLRNAPQEHAVVVSTDDRFGGDSAAELARWSTTGDGEESAGVGYQAHRLPHWFAGDEMWPAGNPARLALIELLNDRFGPLHDPAAGTRIGIGVATGADRTYVIADPSGIEPDRALPLAVGRDLRTGTYEWGGNFLANPWAPDGTLVDLADYPMLRQHLETAGDQLRGRHTAKKSPANWHRTIDKVNHAIIDQPKLLFRDLGAVANPVLEPGGYYPHHNLYFLVSDTWDLEVLGGLLLSRIAQAFIEAYGVRMRGGTLRFQAQYLKRIRVPDPATIDPTTAEELRTAFRARDADAATTAAATAYGIDLALYDLLPEGDPR